MPPLVSSLSSIAALRSRYKSGVADPLAEADAALARSNSNAGRNIYLEQDAAWTRAQAARLDPSAIDSQPLWGIPVSLKDCFDLAGFHTSCGSQFYRDHNGIAAADSAVAERLRAAGAVIMGKTHLHQVAFGITGENIEFGDCVQPADARRLTGGSSSGAAASVQEGSAMAAIGTDTGGSIRLPAALCGLAGYRSSITLQSTQQGGLWQGGLWQGGHHLAPSFDTVGWLYRDLADGPTLGNALLGLPHATAPPLDTLRAGVPDDAFLHDCDSDVMQALQAMTQTLAGRGVTVERFDASLWSHASTIFFKIQAAEAAVVHRGNFEHLEGAIRERLVWGATVTPQELEAQRHLLQLFREQTAALFQRFDYLLLPCAPMSVLWSGSDQSQARPRILRYTTPMSLCGLPVVAIPASAGGMQLVGRLGSDASLLAASTQFVAFDERSLIEPQQL